MMLKRSNVLVVAVNIMKFIMNVSKTKDSRLEITGGIEGSFLLDVLHGLGFEHRVVIPEDGEYGFLTPNGSWTGVIGMVQRGEADLSMGGLIITEQRRRDVDFSRPYLITPLSFAIGKPQKHHLKNAYLYPFHIVVWGCCLGVLIAMSATLYFVLKQTHSLVVIFLELFGNMLGQSLQFKTTSLNLKYFVALWLLCAAVLSASYSGALLAFLFSPTQGKTVQNFLELSNAISRGKVHAYVIEGGLHASYLKETEQEYLKVIGTAIETNKWHAKMTDIRHIKEVVTEKVAFISATFLLKMNFFIEEQQSEVFICSDPIAESHVGFALNRNFCCREKLDKMITRVLGAGLLEKYINDASFLTYLLDARNKQEVQGHEHQIGLVAISGTFQLLLYGYALSFITLLGEILYFKFNMRKQIRGKCKPHPNSLRNPASADLVDKIKYTVYSWKRRCSAFRF
ncbi:hypothetical protein JTE90_007858 [Oedothorax gibbosus]|uniref:Ionotropic glutamate receptor L-glutamate and glycine-binding domain-containing protein n=1 Tax=Oedothorax gibbosus TaxID=931172 RepID=A0AAV6VH79_9ARAC|nr:hypothetical protein JTE90_007858 [Oedothorax gibbosus]